jgi:hypothetical protein
LVDVGQAVSSAAEREPEPEPAPPPAPVSLRERMVAVALHGAQLAILAAALAVAVVATRHDDAANARPLVVVEEVRVSHRTTSGGVALVVIAGVVHNVGDADVPGVVVEARVGDAVVRGTTRGVPDPLGVGRATNAADVARMTSVAPPDTRLGAGQRAPFVIVAAAPPGDGVVDVDTKSLVVRSTS